MKASKKLISSIVVLALTIVFAGATTFAWFSMNTTVDVGNIDSTVTTGTAGLYISLTENGEYGTTVTFTPAADFKMDACTSKGQDMVDEAGKKSTSYINFTVYFRADKNMTLKPSGTVVPKGEADATQQRKAWIAQADASVYGQALVKDSPMVTRAAYAARLAVGAYLWDPNPDLGFKRAATRNLAQDYNWALKHSDASLPTTALNADPMVGPTTSLTLTANGAFYTGSVTLKVWIEGTDNDCIKSIFNDKLSASFNFVGTEV